MNVITQAFAGHLGEVELTAISIANTLIVGFIFGLLLGMASALEMLCGQAFGAKRYHLLGIILAEFPLQRFLQCQLQNMVIAWVSFVGLLINAFTSWLSIYVFDFGVVGAAIALDISWWFWGSTCMLLVVGVLRLGLFFLCKHFLGFGNLSSFLLPLVICSVWRTGTTEY
ncbi:hypothetical protein ACFX13_020038 [Malus domestica]